jgi:hypothetical protein
MWRPDVGVVLYVTRVCCLDFSALKMIWSNWEGCVIIALRASPRWRRCCGHVVSSIDRG